MTGNEIKKIRDDLGLTQTDFGRLLNAHFVTISRWESNTKRPNKNQLELIKEFKRAAQRKKFAKGVLIAGGIAAALFLILQASRK